MNRILFRFTCLLLIMAGTSIVTIGQVSHGGRPFSIQNQKYDWSCDVQTMPSFDVASMMAEDEINNATKDVPYRFGKNFDVNLTTENSGTWFKLANGDRIWLLAIESQGAISINLFFDQWSIPEGATFYIYDETGQRVQGAYTSENNLADGTFATYPLMGSKIFIEYYEPLNSIHLGEISLKTVTHAYRDVENIARAIGDSGSCNNDIVCPVSAGWENEIRSVAMIVVGSNGICTGALINNTANNGFPYFLTANHCVGGSVSTWVIRFNFEATTCGGAISETYQTAVGTTLLANGAASDYALLQINGGVTIPTAWSPYYAGWDSSTGIPSSACGIHHPSGDLKKISFENNACTITGYGGGAGTDHVRVIDWDSGTTEPGSSGSPLFNQNHKIVGQLHGGSAACGNNLSDYYGRFNTTFPNLCAWLAPGQCGLTSLNGYDPLVATVALDAQVQTIVAPTGTTCGTQITPQVTIRNAGSTTLTSFTLSYNVDGGSNLTYNYAGSLATNATVTITLPVMTVATGAHVFNATVSSPNGGVDQNAANNTGTSNFTMSTGTLATFTLTTDCWGEEVSWILENAANTVIQSVAANTLGDQQTFTYNFCLADGCYDMIISDSFGDGLAGIASGCPTNGNYTMTSGGSTLFQMGAPNYGTGITHNFCITTAGTPGCTNPAACNYNPAATVDNGTCIIPPSNDQCSGATLLTINGAVVNGTNATTCVDGPNPTCGGASAIKDVWYKFVYNGGNVIVTTTVGTLTDTRIAVFSSCGGTELGCNDDITGTNLASSLTFNCPTLTTGQTYYIQVGGFNSLTGGFGIQVTSTNISGCTNPVATNYNACANVDDGSCIIPGCIDPIACNYNSSATQSDGSCIYSVTYWGDNDNDGYGSPAAEVSTCNSQPPNTVTNNLDCDDTNDTVYPGAAGTHLGLDNNCNAVIDPDEELNTTCFGDFDNNGVINTSDILLFMASFGCPSSCGIFDLDGNTVVNTADLLLLMAVFGTVCP